MGEELPDGQMIEIGDPTEEGPTPVPVPQVVIEYRERGVPWMLIPPMLVLAAVASVMLHQKFAPPPPPRRSTSVAVAAPLATPSDASTATEVKSGPAPAEAIPPVGLPSGPSNPFELPGAPNVEVSAAPDEVPVPSDIPKPAEPPPFPRVQNLGFDPQALAEPAANPAPPVDEAVAPAADGPTRREEPARDASPDQPREVDPDLLPPDPREARVRRERRVVEAKQQAEAERGKFHAELRAVCRKLGTRSSTEITALCKRYNTEIDPAIKQKAVRLLGPAGAYEGAGRVIRINLLRSLGFPEPTILGDLVDNLTRHENDAVRDGLGSEADATYPAAMILLQHPPSRVATQARPVSNSRPTPLALPGPTR